MLDSLLKYYEIEERECREIRERIVYNYEVIEEKILKRFGDEWVGKTKLYEHHFAERRKKYALAIVGDREITYFEKRIIIIDVFKINDDIFAD